MTLIPVKLDPGTENEPSKLKAMSSDQNSVLANGYVYVDAVDLTTAPAGATVVGPLVFRGQVTAEGREAPGTT